MWSNRFIHDNEYDPVHSHPNKANAYKPVMVIIMAMVKGTVMFMVFIMVMVKLIVIIMVIILVVESLLSLSIILLLLVYQSISLSLSVSFFIVSVTVNVIAIVFPGLSTVPHLGAIIH